MRNLALECVVSIRLKPLRYTVKRLVFRGQGDLSDVAVNSILRGPVALVVGVDLTIAATAKAFVQVLVEVNP